MAKYRNEFRIESARIPGYDYSQPNWYYITINTKNHRIWFGKIIDGKMVLNGYGNTAKDCWYGISNHFSNVEIDSFIVMPNHLHGIIIIADQFIKNGIYSDTLSNADISTTEVGRYSAISPKTGSLAAIIRSFKAVVTKRIHEAGDKGFNWQTRFYDRVIRNEKELYQIRKYIQLNPLKWDIEKNSDENLNLLF